MESYNKQYHSSVNSAAVTAGKPFFQPKLTINNPNDKYEQEADTMADKVMHMETPSLQTKQNANSFFTASPITITPVQRKCAHCDKEEKMQRKEVDGEETTADSSLENYVGGLSSGGQPLPNETRNFFESRFGYDFSNVKIHTDTLAAKSAQSINALAYTSGSSIVFNSNQYSLNTDSGKRLLGHELTHVVQQGNEVKAKNIQRDEAVSEHSKSGIAVKPFTKGQYEDNSNWKRISGYNYWYRKIDTIYELKWASNEKIAEQIDNDGLNMLLSKAWEFRPANTPSAVNPTAVTETMLLPIRVNIPYEPSFFYCMFSYSYNAVVQKPLLNITIIDTVAKKPAPVEIDKKISAITTVPSDIYKKLDTAIGYNFPDNDAKKYFAKHAEVKESIAKYVQWKFAEFKKDSIKQEFSTKEIVKINEINKGQTIPLLLIVQIEGDTDMVNFISLHYSAERSSNAVADYNKKDYIDFLIEEDEKKHLGTDKLGSINGLDAIADEKERQIIKAMAFFIYSSESAKNGIPVKERSYRDTEVDQIVPITTDGKDPAKTVYYYYSFILHKATPEQLVNISVKKIGEKGDAIVGDSSKPLIARVPGYKENGFDANNAETPDQFKKWLLARYKSIKPADITGATIAEIEGKANVIIETGSKTSDWFKKNYDLKILNLADGIKRLKDVHKTPEPERAVVKEYTSDELKFLELSLQKFSKALLNRIKNVNFIRQQKNLSTDFGWVSGLTQQPYRYNTSTKAITVLYRTIIMYDSVFTEDGSFFGGIEGVNDTHTNEFTHELGHVVGKTYPGNKISNATYQDRFNKFYKELNLTPVTKYAKDKSNPTHSPDSEFFPEAFMLFMTDPEWLLNNQYQTYLWFLYLQENGLYPSADQIKSLINLWETQKAIQGNMLSSGITQQLFYLWKTFTLKAKTFPDAKNESVLLKISSEFINVQKRMIRFEEAVKVITKWLAFVKKSKTQPGIDEIRTFF